MTNDEILEHRKNCSECRAIDRDGSAGRWLPEPLTNDGRLLSCPFCGADARLIEIFAPDHGFRVQCQALTGCHATSGDWKRTDDAISAWNRRAGESQ